MSTQSVTLQINVSATNGTAVVQQLTANFGSLQNVVNNVKNISLKSLVDNVENVTRALTNAIQPGADFESSMADLSAIAGVVGNDLKEIGDKARANAKIFGGDAAKSVETYKLLLSQLSPELGKTPAALDAMGKNIATLSKTMGGNVTAAAEVLTTAMNQYQVSLDDPIAASEKMAEMMNIMAAAANEGSAELPQIKTALEQVGMVAKTANVSFAETNAAIQVLDKAGKKGSEGGVALRNIIGDLDKGRFLPKVIKEEFKAVGVDVDVLGNHALSLTDRLRALQPIMNDTALLTKLFGEANYASGVALLSQIDELDRLNEAIQGTNTAEEQAAIIMDTYHESVSRIQAKFADLKISIFNATGSFLPFVEVVGSGAVEVARLVPLVTLMSGLFKKELWVSVGKATMAVATWTKGIVWNKLILSSWYAIQGICITVTNLLTGSINLATAATRIFNATFVSSPLGWIALGIGAIAGVFALLRNNARGAAEETGKTLANLKEQASLNIQDEAQRDKAEAMKQKDIMNARLNAAETDEERKQIIAESAQQYNIKFDEKEFDKDTEAYITGFNKAIDEAFDAGAARNNIEKMIGALREELQKIEPLAIADEEWNKEWAGKIKVEAKAAQFSEKGSSPYIPAVYHKSKLGNIAKREELEKDILKLNKELASAIRQQNEITVKQNQTIIPGYKPDADKVSDTIKGGEGIKNINITINDGLVKDVNNYFNNGESDPGVFMDKLREALMMVLNDANTI